MHVCSVQVVEQGKAGVQLQLEMVHPFEKSREQRYGKQMLLSKVYTWDMDVAESSRRFRRDFPMLRFGRALLQNVFAHVGMAAIMIDPRMNASRLEQPMVPRLDSSCLPRPDRMRSHEVQRVMAMLTKAIGVADMTMHGEGSWVLPTWA